MALRGFPKIYVLRIPLRVLDGVVSDHDAGLVLQAFPVPVEAYIEGGSDKGGARGKTYEAK